MSRNLRKLVHLRPPAGVAPIEDPHRFSPYHQDPGAFGIELPTGSRYFHLYPFPEEEVARFCYVFEAEVPRSPNTSPSCSRR